MEHRFDPSMVATIQTGKRPSNERGKEKKRAQAERGSSVGTLEGQSGGVLDITFHVRLGGCHADKWTLDGQSVDNA